MASFIPIRLRNRNEMAISLYNNNNKNINTKFRDFKVASNPYNRNSNYNTARTNYSQTYHLQNDFLNIDSPINPNNNNEHIKDILKNEANLKMELSNKNKKINEYENLIQIQENKIEQLKVDYNNIYEQFNDIMNTNKNLIQKNKQYESEINNYENIFEENKKEKEKYEKEYKLFSKKINELHENKSMLKNYKNKTDLIQQENLNLIKENEKILFDNNILKEEISNIQKEKLNIDSIYNNLKRDYEKMKDSNSKLYEDNEILNREINTLKHDLIKLSGSNEKNENELKNLIGKIQKKEDENVINKNNYMKVITYSNDNIDNISRWIQHYLTEVYNENIEIPDLNINNNIREVNFNKIKNNLIQAKSKIDNNIKRLENENKNLKYSLTLNQDENFKNQKYLENLFNTMKYEIEKNNYFRIEVKKQISLDINYKQEIENVLKNIFNILYKIKDANPENIIDNLRLENENLKKQSLEFEKLKNFSQNINLENKDLKKENYKLKEELKIIEQLNKENKKLKEEIEIKKSMINNQRLRLEEKDNKDLKIEELEKDRNNLLKDNIILIKDNGLLKQKLNMIQNQIKQNEDPSIERTRYSED